MRQIRLLTVGNSFSENALTFLQDLARDSGDLQFVIGRASLGGCSLKKHWNLAQFTERHPEHQTYVLWTNPDGSPHGASLQACLQAAPWNFITFQQFSGESWMRSTFEPYLGNLISLARTLAPQARILLHQTWAYRADSPFLPEHCLTPEIMFARIRENYSRFSQTHGCGLLPSGEAIYEAGRAAGKAFCWPDSEFDFAAAEPPALPRQENSFHSGWYWAINHTADGIPQLRLDANHLNTRGCYLASCVWFERLTGRDVRACSFVPKDMTVDDAAWLREIAHTVCGRHPPL